MILNINNNYYEVKNIQELINIFFNVEKIIDDNDKFKIGSIWTLVFDTNGLIIFNHLNFETIKITIIKNKNVIKNYLSNFSSNMKCEYKNILELFKSCKIYSHIKINKKFLFIINDNYFLIDYIDELCFTNMEYENFSIYYNDNGFFNQSVIMFNKTCTYIKNNIKIKIVKVNSFNFPYTCSFIKKILNRLNVEFQYEEDYLLK